MKHFLLALGFIFLFSCAANGLVKGAEKVRIVTETPGKECEFLGNVEGSQGNWFSGGFTSNSAMERGSRNSLINEAYQLGANTVHIITNRAGSTATKSGSSQTNVTMTGGAYKCP